MNPTALLARGAAITVIAVAGCTIAAPVGNQAARPAAARTSGLASGPCPTRAPQPRPGADQRTAQSTLIRRDPVAAVICQYNVHRSPAGLTRVPKVVLAGTAAAGLAALIDDLPPVKLWPNGCGADGGRFSQLIRFAYAAGPARSAVVTSPGCPAMEITVGGRLAVPNVIVAQALTGYAAGSWGNRGPRTPDLAGLSLAAAEATASRHGLRVSLAGVVTDTRVPFGTVIFQALPPGTRARLHNGPQVSVVIAARPAPACTAAKLRLTYRSAAAIRGSDYGSVVIRDTGPAPCTLTGLIRIRGITGTGRAVTNAFSSRIPATVILGPNAAPVPDNPPSPNVIPPPSADLAGAIWLYAEYRITPDSPAGTLCRPHWITPAAWRVTLPGNLSFTVPNADPGGPSPVVPSGGLVTCGGRLDDASLIYDGQPLS
jgi:hypothetical protein